MLGAWGVHGALKLESLTDFPERFDVGAALWLLGARHTVTRSHWHRGAAIVSLSGIEEPDRAGALRGALVELPEAQLHPLDEDEYYEHDLIGLRVETASGDELGHIVRIHPTGANAVIEVSGAGGVYLLPLIADVVQAINVEQRRMCVELMEGLEPLAVPAPKPPRPHGRAPRHESNPASAGAASPQPPAVEPGLGLGLVPPADPE